MPKPHTLKQSEGNRNFLSGNKMKVVIRIFVMSALAVPIAIGTPANGFDKMDLQKLISTKACEACDLSDANLREVELSGALLSHANLLNAQLGGANLSFAKLSHIDLRGADLWGANLMKTDLRNSN